MLADSQTYPICTQNFIQIGPAVLEEFDFKHRDTRFLFLWCCGCPWVAVIAYHQAIRML